MCPRRQKGLFQAFFFILIFGGLSFAMYFYHSMNLKIAESEKLLEAYKKQRESLQSHLEVVYDHRAKLEKSFQKEKMDHKKTKQDKEESQQDHEVLLERTKHEATNRFNALDTEHKMLNAKFENLQTEHKRLQQQHVRAVQDHQSTINAMSDNTKKIRQQMEENNRGWSDSYRKLNQEKLEVDTNLKMYQDQLQKKVADNDVAREHLLAVIKRLKEQASKVQLMKDASERETEKLRLKYKEADKKLQDLQVEYQREMALKAQVHKTIPDSSKQTVHTKSSENVPRLARVVKRNSDPPPGQQEKKPLSHVPTQQKSVLNTISQHEQEDNENNLHKAVTIPSDKEHGEIKDYDRVPFRDSQVPILATPPKPSQDIVQPMEPVRSDVPALMGQRLDQAQGRTVDGQVDGGIQDWGEHGGHVGVQDRGQIGELGDFRQRDGQDGGPDDGLDGIQVDGQDGGLDGDQDEQIHSKKDRGPDGKEDDGQNEIQDGGQDVGVDDGQDGTRRFRRSERSDDEWSDENIKDEDKTLEDINKDSIKQEKKDYLKEQNRMETEMEQELENGIDNDIENDQDRRTADHPYLTAEELPTEGNENEVVNNDALDNNPDQDDIGGAGHDNHVDGGHDISKKTSQQTNEGIMFEGETNAGNTNDNTKEEVKHVDSKKKSKSKKKSTKSKRSSKGKKRKTKT